MITEDVSHLDIEAKVERVAGYLDDDKPGWRDALTEKYGTDLADLRVSDPFNCVLSAVYGDYSYGWHRLVGVGLGAYGDAIACIREDNDKLRNAWLDAVRRRN